jgi:hypothetical protein
VEGNVSSGFAQLFASVHKRCARRAHVAEQRSQKGSVILEAHSGTSMPASFSTLSRPD